MIGFDSKEQKNGPANESSLGVEGAVNDGPVHVNAQRPTLRELQKNMRTTLGRILNNPIA
jgi:hypothetical protein